MEKGRPGIKPKKKNITKNAPPKEDFKPVITNPAGIKHFYKGTTPPWEYESMIMAASDLVRIEAYHLEVKAARLRYKADEMDMVA